MNVIVGGEKQRLDVKVALSNSFGFGGHNSSVLFAPYVASEEDEWLKKSYYLHLLFGQSLQAYWPSLSVLQELDACILASLLTVCFTMREQNFIHVRSVNGFFFCLRRFFLFVISQKLMLLTIWSYSAVWEAHLCREINEAPDEATFNLGGGQQWQKIVQTDNQLGSLRIEGLLVSYLGELLQVWNQSARLHHIPLDQKFIDMQVFPHSVDFRIIRLSSLAYIPEYIHWLACTWQTAGHWVQKRF